jgi:hypothetical protein
MSDASDFLTKWVRNITPASAHIHARAPNPKTVTPAARSPPVVCLLANFFEHANIKRGIDRYGRPSRPSRRGAGAYDVPASRAIACRSRS